MKFQSKRDAKHYWSTVHKVVHKCMQEMLKMDVDVGVVEHIGLLYDHDFEKYEKLKDRGFPAAKESA